MVSDQGYSPIIDVNQQKAFKQGGESKPYKIYKNYVMGNTSDKNSEKIYDKLNRMHYREAKQAGMDVPNYIMTYLSGNS